MVNSCIQDNFFRLCEECDKVFHKSAAKRSHIRIPVLNLSSFSATAMSLSTSEENSPNGLHAGLQQDVSEGLAGSKTYLQWVPLLQEVKPQYAAVLLVVRSLWGPLSPAYHSKDMLLWREMTSCLIYNALLNLVEDRKVSAPFLYSSIVLF